MLKSKIVRLKTVIDAFYGGNVAAAARALEVEASTIKRYLAGEFEPPAQTLKLLASLHALDLEWLKKGPGLKIKYSSKANTGEDSRPVTTAAVATVPTHDSFGFTGMFRQVQPFHNVADRFWFRVSTPMQAGVLAGDYVLIRVVRQRLVEEGDVGKLFMLRRAGHIQFDQAQGSDVNNAKITGIAIMLERDMAY